MMHFVAPILMLLLTVMIMMLLLTQHSSTAFLSVVAVGKMRRRRNIGIRTIGRMSTSSSTSSSSRWMMMMMMMMMAQKAKNDDDNDDDNDDRYNDVRSVAIIGGGLAGLSCARHLQQLQQYHQQQQQKQDPIGPKFHVTVFDTGRLRPGGRASSRRPNDEKSKNQSKNNREKSNQKDTSSSSWLDSFRYDHAAQFIVSRRPKSRPPEEDTKATSIASSSSSSSTTAAAVVAATEDAAISWRSDFDDWIDQLHSQGILQMAPPDSIFKVQLLVETGSNIDVDNGKVTKKKTMMKKKNKKKVQKIRYESLQSSSSSSFDFFYPTQGMAALSEVLVNRVKTTLGPNTNHNNDVGLPLDVRQDVWVSPSNGIEYLPDTNQWLLLKAKGRPLGTFDVIVLAHNGKCAERLIRPTPAKRIHQLMRVNFNDRIAVVGNNKKNNNDAGQNNQDDAQNQQTQAQSQQKMTLNSLYSYTVCLKAPSVLKQALPDGFVAGFVTTTTTTSSTNATTDSEKDQHHQQQQQPQQRRLAAAHGRISMITNQVPGKYRDDNNNTNINNNKKKNCEIWTIFSTATFAKQYKAPQEALPDDVQDEVCRLLLESLQRDIVDVALAGSTATTTTTTSSATPPSVLLKDQILDQRLQLWGAAVPLNVWESHSGGIDDNDTSTIHGNNDHYQQQQQDGFLYDAEYGVGVCGDWLMEPSLAGAWTSGKRLADHLLSTSSTTVSSSSSTLASVGLQDGQFRVSPAVQQLGIAALWDTDGDEDDFDYGDNDDDLTSKKTSNNVSRRKPSSRNGSSGDSRQRGSNHFRNNHRRNSNNNNNNQRGRHKSSRNRTLSGSNKNGGQVTSTSE